MKLMIDDPVGLHARPVAVLVKAAQQYKADIRVQHEGKSANAKSMISVLRLGARCGEQIEMFFDGADADSAERALQTLFESDLKQEFSIVSD